MKVGLDDFSVYDDFDGLASAILLCAWIRAAQEAWGDDWYGTDTDCCGGKMSVDLVEELLRLACSKDALRLNRDGRPWAASQASEVSAQPNAPSATDDVNSEEVEDRLSEKRFRERFDRTQPSEPSPLVEPVSAEEPDRAILDRLPGLTKEDLERIAEIP